MRRISLSTILISTSVLAVIWVAWFFLGTEMLGFGDDYAKAGVFGDSFGAVTSLFSMLGFVGILITIWQQQDDQHIQRFESSFFQMLQLLRDLRNEVVFKFSPEYRAEFGWEAEGAIVGVEAFSGILREFTWIHFVEKNKPEAIDDDARGAIERAYKLTVEEQRGFSVEPYFRVLYTVLKRIDEDSVLSVEQKLNYGRLVRSQLTADEVALSGINGLYFRSKNFQEYVIKFRLLKYLTEANEIRKLIEEFYPIHTFFSSTDIPEYNKKVRRRGKLRGRGQ
ncbi:putative phage abortive infection protein [Neorhizobium sp. T7_12]|uniref:putative phage abortive infection protein n=1 Tax=Neorhizobium sp. T7_12 TaxID=2093832 RepID=UPI00155F45AD|nr:putative phage abortive infection protein [Neorhizobium sp. T7_12]